MGLPVALAAAGVKALSDETITRGSSRPSAVSPKTRDPNDIGSARLHPAEEVHGLGIGRGRAEVGFFRHRLPNLGDLVGEGGAGSEGDEGDEAKQSFHGRHSSPSQFYRKGAKYAKDIADLTRRTGAVF